MILTIREFPDELRWQLRVKADQSGVTLRKFLINVLQGVVDGKIAGVERAAASEKTREVGARIKGQMERLSKPAESEGPESEDELKF